MKLADTIMDSMMEDLLTEKDISSAPSSRVNLPMQNTYLQLTPMSGPSQPPATPRPRRNTVSVACERCRKRKIKCSGLPGPCSNCLRLNVPCYEPGNRKGSVQSTLDERIQRLRRLTAAARYDQHEQQMQAFETHDPSNYLTAEPSQSLGDAAWGTGSTTPPSLHDVHGWMTSEDAASYFGSHLRQPQDWSASDISNEDVPILSRTSYLTLDPQDMQRSDLSNFSTMGEDTAIASEQPHASQTHEMERPTERSEQTPLGFTISYDSADYDESEEEQEPGESHAKSPSIIEDGMRSGKEDPARSVEIPISSHDSTLDPLSSLLAGSTFVRPGHNTDQELSFGHQLTRSRTTPTSHLQPAGDETPQETGLLNLIIRSDDTRRYVVRYFASVHQMYPFLDSSIFQDERPLVEQLSNLGQDLMQQQAMRYFQTLLVAGIGALVQHESDGLSSQYVKQAMVMQEQFDMWSSVNGIHCALLIAVYCYLAQVMVYDTRHGESAESQQSMHTTPRSTRYPVNNIWLHNCQVAAACIDLGMHQPLAMQEQIRSRPDITTYLESCRNTFRSAYMLDRRISDLRNRPRAFHDGDIDQSLLANL